MNRVLIVSDAAALRRELGSWIRVDSGEIIEAATCEEASGVFKRKPPDLIILDLDLRECSGVDLCRRWKEDESLGRTPIMVLAGEGSEELRLACVEAGVDDFMIKPGSRSELVTRSRALLRAKALSDRLLISYHELDRLGDFAEGFVRRSVADWSRQEVAEAMARHVLDVEGRSVERPSLLWAARRVGELWSGGCWRRVEQGLVEVPVEVEAGPVHSWLSQHPSGADAFIVRYRLGDQEAELLGVPEAEGLRGVVALLRNRNLLLAAGYPWDVGTYEIALLRAMHRQWDAFERIRLEARHTEQAFFLTMDALALAAEFYQRGTAAHIRRVGLLSAEIARSDNASRRFMRWLRQSAKLHDVGKITIPLSLLTREEGLSAGDLERLKRHTIDGERLLSGSGHLEMARRIARSHHECWDGSGYPDGLAGDAIPYEARIVKLADVYDALRSERSYKPTFSHDEALKVLTEGDARVQPRHFDPHLLKLFVEHEATIEERYSSVAPPTSR